MGLMSFPEQVQFRIKGAPDGSKPVFVFLPDRPLETGDLDTFFQVSDKDIVSLVLVSALPDGKVVESFAQKALESISQLGVKRATLVGIGAGGALAQAMTIGNRKLCRRLVLVDASCRLRPSKAQLIFDKLESLLPFGLPFRADSGDFDSRPYLHRIDCPTLVVTGEGSSRFQLRQAKFFVSRLPNSWYLRLEGLIFESSGRLSPKLSSTIENFYQMPTKRPQKRLTNVVSDLPLAS